MASALLPPLLLELWREINPRQPIQLALFGPEATATAVPTQAPLLFAA